MQSEKMKEILFEVIGNQITNKNPPETSETYTRLIDLGYSDNDTRALIGRCLIVEMYGALKHGKPYNNARYVKNLQNLPEKPVEE